LEGLFSIKVILLRNGVVFIGIIFTVLGMFMLLTGQSGVEYLSAGGSMAYLLLSHIIPTGDMEAYMKIYQALYAAGGSLAVVGIITALTGIYQRSSADEDDWSVSAMIIIGILIIAAVIAYIYRIKTIFAI
jgi:hypothetical protein